jgi:hypothetical protein
VSNRDPPRRDPRHDLDMPSAVLRPGVRRCHAHCSAIRLENLLQRPTVRSAARPVSIPTLFPAGHDLPLHPGFRAPICTLHAATHVPLALVVTQRRQAFWQSFWSLVRSTVSSTPPVASFRRAFSRGAWCDDTQDRPLPC